MYYLLSNLARLLILQMIGVSFDLTGPRTSIALSFDVEPMGNKEIHNVCLQCIEAMGECKKVENKKGCRDSIF